MWPTAGHAGILLARRQLQIARYLVDRTNDLKQEARQLVDQLPEQASWDDLMYEIYVRQSIEAGLADVQAGRVVPHDDVMARILRRK